MVRRLLHITRRTRAFRSGQRKMFRHLLSLRGSPEAMALGTALGVFVAFTPTVGFQMLLAAALATLLRASRPAAIVPVWITNPATIPFLFVLTYKVGAPFCSGPLPSAEEVSQILVKLVTRLGTLEFYAFYSQMKALLQITGDILLPMTIGGVLVGALAGLVTYPAALRVFRGFHNFREKRRSERQKRREES